MSRTPVGDDELAHLMRAAQCGDQRAYRRLLQDITPRLRNFVRSMRPFLQPADIEDLVQDILLSLHAVRATYDSSRPFMPWLLAIAQHRMADAARRYARRAAHEVQVDSPPVTFSDAETNTAGETYRNREALERAVRALPPGQRKAVEMLKLREMSLREAAAASGTSVAALKVAVHRAIGALRRRLTKESDHDEN
jgi:RNA polymerase sigma factor (sigma-70 family)